MKTISEYISDILPKSVIYFVLIKAWPYASCGKYGDTIATDITMTKVIERWDDK